MPSLLASMVLGFVESSTPLYRTVSKYPAKPWHVPRLGMGKVSVVLRALCALDTAVSLGAVGRAGLGC